MEGLRGAFAGQAVSCSRLSARPTKVTVQTSCVATPVKPPSTKLAKRSKVEIVKEKSDFLRHPLMEELVNENSYINEDAVQLMKFHGSYQQDHREKRAFGQGKFYQFMMRTRQPGGTVPNQLYLTMDDLSEQYGNGTLRLTTRQTYQLHGVLKQDLKTVFSSVIKNMGSTLAACGDVNRNVLASPAPYKNRPEYQYATQYANDIADLLAPQSGAYYDVWLDGEKFFSHEMENPKVTADRAFNGYGTNFENSPEPIYGNLFLPRKFKVAITVPGDNSVDLFTNDLGLVVITSPSGELEGFDIVVGGGMGRTHRNESTFARLADAIGYVPKEDVFHAVKAIVATQRDYGRRDDRKMSRLKYLVNEWGIDKFRSVVEQYYGKRFQPFRPLPKWEFKDFLGWMDQGDGKLAYGIYIQNGRLKGDLKKALRRVIERYELPVRLTPNQNIILCDIEETWKADIISTLSGAGIKDTDAIDSLDRYSMACPALPLCGLAIGEAERGLPDINNRIRALMNKLGFGPDEHFHIRMTGCPNGCTRPYMAELGFVGDGPNSYQLWLGGTAAQTRLAEPFMERMKVQIATEVKHANHIARLLEACQCGCKASSAGLQNLESTLEPILVLFHQQRRPTETLGDFCARVGFEAIRKYSYGYVSEADAGKLPQVGLPADLYKSLEAIAAKQGKSLAHVACEAVRQYVQ